MELIALKINRNRRSHIGDFWSTFIHGSSALFLLFGKRKLLLPWFATCARLVVRWLSRLPLFLCATLPWRWSFAIHTVGGEAQFFKRTCLFLFKLFQFFRPLQLPKPYCKGFLNWLENPNLRKKVEISEKTLPLFWIHFLNELFYWETAVLALIIVKRFARSDHHF